MHFIVHAVRFVIENGPWTVAGAAVTVAVLYLLVAPSVPVGRCTGVGELEGIWGILGFKCLGGRVAYTEPELFAFIAAGLIVATFPQAL